MNFKKIFIEPKSIVYDEVIKHEASILNNIDELINKIKNDLGSDYIKKKNNVFIHKSVEINDNVTIVGPAIIGENTILRSGAYLRKNVIIGKNVIVGHGTEIKNSIIFDKVEIPHFNYVGDSILGYKSHLGAGVIIANLRLDKNSVNVNDTSFKKFGALIGDNVTIGCNSVINPGTIIYPNNLIKPLSSIKGVINTTNK